MSAVMLPKVWANRRVRTLERSLERERTARIEAERSALRFHALLIAERIRRLPPSTQTSGGARTILDGSSASTAPRRVSK